MRDMLVSRVSSFLAFFCMAREVASLLLDVADASSSDATFLKHSFGAMHSGHFHVLSRLTQEVPSTASS